MIADRRFTDRHVREDEELVDIAFAYARDYKGDWDVMQSAHDLAAEEGTLPVPIARMVLNVMRADPAAQHLVPKGRPKIAEDDVIELADYRKRNGGKNKMPQEPKNKFPFIVSTRWNVRYALSTHKLAQVAHIIRDKPPIDRRGIWDNYTFVRYVPRTKAYEVKIHAWCSKNWFSWMYRTDDYVADINKMGVLLTNDLQGRRICQQCLYMEARYNAHVQTD